jgi:hypothetical protein
MISSSFYSGRPTTVESQRRRAALTQSLWIIGILGLSAALSLLIYRRTPTPSFIAWAVLLVAIAATIYQPRYGVYLIAGLTLMGDAALTPWFPFTKNFSSWESLLYLHDAVIFSPLELFLALTLCSLALRWISQRRLSIHTGVLFWPAIIFGLFIAFGLIYGLSRGGNLVIALWASRHIFALPLMLVLVTNLITTRAHVHVLIWWIVWAIFLDALGGAIYVAVVLNFDWSSVQRIAEHSFSIHIDSLFILFLGAWVYKASAAKRITLTLMLPVLMISFVANQRRASYVAFVVALIIWGVLLFWQNRKLFWVVVPTFAVLGAIYLALYWNSGGGLIGGPARVIRNAIAPVEGGEEASSNLYRLIENINTMFTIRSAPLTGIGFGNKFYIIAPMADISFFTWWEYITHNSILWIWMQAGIGGFFSLIFLIAMTLSTGARTVLRMPGGDLTAISLMALTYVAMHFVFAYVDTSWEPQSMILVGTMMGLINSLERIVAAPIATDPPRWPWQTITPPAQGLRAF